MTTIQPIKVKCINDIHYHLTKGVEYYVIESSPTMYEVYRNTSMNDSFIATYNKSNFKIVKDSTAI